MGYTPNTADIATNILQDSVNTEFISRLGALQANRRHLSAAWDNVPQGLQNTTVILAASNGVNVNTFAGAGVLNVASTAQALSPSGPRFAPSPQILQVQLGAPGSGAGFVQISYTGSTATTLTGCTTLNGGAGALQTGASVFFAPTAVADVVVCSDSLFYGQGSNLGTIGVGQATTDWFTALLAKENEQAGLPDPGRGWRRCTSPFFAGDSWSGLTATITAVSGSGTVVTFTCANWFTAGGGQTVTLSGLAGGFAGLNGAQTVASASATQFTVTNATTGATTTGTASMGTAMQTASIGPSVGGLAASSWNPGATNNIIQDSFPFRRAVVHVQKQTNGAGVQVSFNGGSSFTATADTNGTGLLTFDSGDLGSYDVRIIQVKQLAAVTGTGAAGVATAGYLPYTNDGTNGVVGYNFAQSSANTTNWINNTAWRTLWLPYIQPRRAYVAIGVIDLSVSTPLATISSNLTTEVQQIQAASPLTEIVLCAEWHVGNHSTPLNTGITYANWSTYVNTIAAVAEANNCTFIDMSSWQGDAAIWTVASVTTTTATASATVASGGFPDVANGMYVQGVGIPGFPNPVTVSSIVGNTVNFAGNTAGIVGTTGTVTFTNDALGISAGDGVHFGDYLRSTSGRDAQQGIADFLWGNLSFYKALAPVAPGPGWSVNKLPWTRVSNTQFTIISPNDLTGIYAKGTKARWSEAGTVKYGAIASSSYASGLVTVNLMVTSDFVMAATPDIGSTWYSYGMPPGFPTVFTWSGATVTGITASGVFVAQYAVGPGTITLYFITAVVPTSNATTFTITGAPIANAGTTATVLGTGTDAAAFITATVVSIAGGATTVVLAKNTAGGTWTASSTKSANFELIYPY